VPVEIVWSPLARARLNEVRAFVAVDKPDAAERLATRIVAVVEALRNHPYLGRAGVEPGIRELPIGGTPYIVLYRVVRGKRVVIHTVWHGAQRRRDDRRKRHPDKAGLIGARQCAHQGEACRSRAQNPSRTLPVSHPSPFLRALNRPIFGTRPLYV
jgi:toxin ParE1/3/4